MEVWYFSRGESSTTGFLWKVSLNMQPPDLTSVLLLLHHGTQVAAFAPVSNVNHEARTAALHMAEVSNIPGPPYAGPASKPILDSVKFPADMKRLNMRELKQVCCSRSLSFYLQLYCD